MHEECLTGLLSLTATVFPTPLALGPSFDPGLVEKMAAAIGDSLRRLGVHLGPAPVLDVTRDYRWGCTEETIGDDPHLVATLGAAYVRGLEGAGVAATVKHFAGYSASAGGRNMAPVACGPREFTDVILEPFVAGLRDGGARAVMASQTDVDGVPTIADQHLLTDVLRGELGFTGLVLADYLAVWNLKNKHGVVDSRGEAAAVAAARDADVCVLTLGDRAGLFGLGTSGEGCDAQTLALPGRQAELAQAVLDTGTPTVVVLISGRPYALGDVAGRAAAVVQTFFPGEEGATAIAGVCPAGSSRRDGCR
ncbi:beta-glucosidase-like glycosyl hydrolase [Streptomyces nodosus]|nr:glycoside hydrolase family 3 N-terminal domain-containing protein [Streptomyces nodosus]MBB4789685.1 beta-glucosidase-like glycosyl hydrolase [Streptomyces nodosus]